MNQGVEFEYSSSFYLSSGDIEDILTNVRNGLTIEEAVVDWYSGLDDSDYFIVLEHLKDRIIEHIEKIYNETAEK